MLFDVFAVLIITFFASLGMIEASNWLLRRSVKSKAKRTVIFAVDVSSVAAEEVEEALRCTFAEAEPLSGKIILDCSSADGEAKEICLSLCRRFNCNFAENKKEIESLVSVYLHNDRKDI